MGCTKSREKFGGQVMLSYDLKTPNPDLDTKAKRKENLLTIIPNDWKNMTDSELFNEADSAESSLTNLYVPPSENFNESALHSGISSEYSGRNIQDNNTNPGNGSLPRPSSKCPPTKKSPRSTKNLAVIPEVSSDANLFSILKLDGTGKSSQPEELVRGEGLDVADRTTQGKSRSPRRLRDVVGGASNMSLISDLTENS
jgi:hypothetical protein